ncbi:MAG TPA: agmatine deiminase family protein [Phycisphaerae bacterium]|nr:agmatine deiminase family protein [Phycisphaerae bacterium]
MPPKCLMPAEWETHDATWIAWPHHEPDWPGKLEAIRWVYADIVRVLARSERVEILCTDEASHNLARRYLDQTRVPADSYRLHVQPIDRTWLRDSAPTAVRAADGSITWIQWKFNAWAKYDDYHHDAHIPAAVECITGLKRIEARRPDRDAPLVLEGGAIDTDGQGTLLVTEECLMSDVQCRNPGLSREGYEQAFREYLGIEKVIWLGSGCAGDDTHGHVDDIARFVAPGKLVLAVESDPADENHAPLQDNLRRLRNATDAAGRRIEVIPIPMPGPVFFEDMRLPASYANFYIANRMVVVPTFNDPNDRAVLDTLAGLFPGRQVIGLHARDLVLGQGTLHCLSQQQPSGP